MPQIADLLIIHSAVFTADPDNPHADAVAISGNRIAWVGEDAEANKWRGPGTRVIDGQGCTLMPGIIDSHYHLQMGSLELADAQLGGLTSLEEVSAALRAAATAEREWVVGRGLNYGILPTDSARMLLDAALPDRPVIVFAYDTHSAWANTAALERAGLLQGADTPRNSEVLIGPDGQASGELRESGAYDPVMALIPPPDASRRRALLRQGLAQAAAHGITSVHNMDGDAEQLSMYSALEDLGELTLRVYVPFTVTPSTDPDALSEAVAMREMASGDLVRAGSVKLFMDGVVESYTALLLEPYAGEPYNYGGANFSPEHFTMLAIEADRRGLQIIVHAVGDGAVRRTLDGYAEAQRVNGIRDSRHRVEHIELVHPDDLPRFAGLGVIASMQPLHAPMTASGLDVWPSRVGQARWDHSFAWEWLRRAGARLVFGSDWPVVDHNPLAGMHAAVNRRPWHPGGVEHRQSRVRALTAYTREAAYAEFQEHEKGQLRAGMLADLVLLSDNLFTVPAENIGAVRPVLTICDGRIVFEG